jgi:hypothetical protein
MTCVRERESVEENKYKVKREKVIKANKTEIKEKGKALLR